MISSWFRPSVSLPKISDRKYSAAVDAIDDIIDRLRMVGRHHPAVSVISDVIRNRNNTPYMTTIFEANAEMGVVDDRASGNAKPAPK
jgi:hypothetical protein